MYRSAVTMSHVSKCRRVYSSDILKRQAETKAWRSMATRMRYEPVGWNSFQRRAKVNEVKMDR
jgi:hypothetical protein